MQCYVPGETEHNKNKTTLRNFRQIVTPVREMIMKIIIHTSKRKGNTR